MFNAPSAISSNIRSEYLDSPLADAPLELKPILAPKKSTSSLKASFVVFEVPVPISWLVMLATPFLSPSA